MSHGCVCVRVCVSGGELVVRFHYIFPWKRSKLKQGLQDVSTHIVDVGDVVFVNSNCLRGEKKRVWWTLDLLSRRGHSKVVSYLCKLHEFPNLCHPGQEPLVDLQGLLAVTLLHLEVFLCGIKTLIRCRPDADVLELQPYN